MKLLSHKMGHLWKFKASEVDEWVRQGKAAEEARVTKETGITTRLQKGGALLSDMRRLVAAWSVNAALEDASAFVMRTLGKPSLARARRHFHPRIPPQIP